MTKIVYALVVGLFGAGIVHIAVLLLVPEFSQKDAWSRLAMVGELYTIVRLDAPLDGNPIVQSGDPLVESVACRFDLENGVVQVRAAGSVPFWSVSVYNRGGQNIYSFNDRATESGVLDFAVLTSEQMIEVRKDVPADFEKSVFVEAPLGEGIVVVRVFVPDESWAAAINNYLGDLTCSLRTDP